MKAYLERFSFFLILSGAMIAVFLAAGVALEMSKIGPLTCCILIAVILSAVFALFKL